MNASYKSIDINLSVNYEDIYKIQNEDVIKLYLREYSDESGRHIKIASTNHPAWMRIKHFFISLFSLFKYSYLSGQKALQKIKRDPVLSSALNEKMRKSSSSLSSNHLSESESAKTNDGSSERRRSGVDIHAWFGVIGIFVGAILFGEKVSAGTGLAADLTSIGLGLTGGFFGAIIGGCSGEDILDSIIKTVAGTCLGVGIGTVSGQLAIIGWRPFTGPVLGGVAGVMVGEACQRIITLVER